MRVELGNHAALQGQTPEPLAGRRVTYMHVPDVPDVHDIYGYEPHDSAEQLADNFLRHLARNPGPVTRLGDVSDGTGFHEAFRVVQYAWPQHSAEAPDWVWSDNEMFGKLLAKFFDCPQGRPDFVEDAYWTTHGGLTLPPGVIPAAVPPELSNTDAARNLRWGQMFGGVGGAGSTGATGTSTGTSATSMTDSGASWGTTQFVGLSVWCGNRYANIISHTGTVLTIDRWYDPTNPGGAAGSTPGATTVYIIGPGTTPSYFMGLSANSSAVVNGDTTLAGEITTASGGLIRKICSLAHTSGATTGTLSAVFTANGSDSLPVTIAKIGIGPSILSTVNQMFLTLLGTTATISLSGDQLSVTDTVTI